MRIRRVGTRRSHALIPVCAAAVQATDDPELEGTPTRLTRSLLRTQSALLAWPDGAIIAHPEPRRTPMTTRLNPYLSFRNNAREAMEFYKDVFGGELTISTFADFQATQDPAEENLVMHAQLESSSGLTLMGSDTPARMEFQPGNTFSVSLSGDDDAELRGYWEKLSDGGTVSMPLETAPWGDTFGMCNDKFGVAWLVNIAGA